MQAWPERDESGHSQAPREKELPGHLHHHLARLHHLPPLQGWAVQPTQEKNHQIRQYNTFWPLSYCGVCVVCVLYT